jgi:hypothetical protein
VNNAPPAVISKAVGHLAGIAGVASAAIAIWLLIAFLAAPQLVLSLALAASLGVSIYLIRVALKLARQSTPHEGMLVPKWAYRVLSIVFLLLSVLILAAFSILPEAGSELILVSLISLFFGGLAMRMTKDR